jgi:hypothetical protein
MTDDRKQKTDDGRQRTELVEVGMREHSAEGLAHGGKKVRISQLNVN